MNLYFDTSALIKFFHTEEGTDIVTDLIESEDNIIYISEIAKIEFYCALYRRLRNKEITKKNLEQAIKGFEIQIKDFNVEPLGSIVVNEAEELIKKYGNKFKLRTLDALHFASYRLISDIDWHFVTTDNNLYDVVLSANFKALNPLKR